MSEWVWYASRMHKYYLYFTETLSNKQVHVNSFYGKN